MKFEKGKKVRIIGNRDGHRYELGSIITMNRECSTEYFYGNIVNDDYWLVRFSDCEEIEEINDKPERYKSREVHGMDVIDLVNHWGLNFQEGNILKYLLRDKGEDESDMQKIADYANRELELIKQRKNK